MTADARHDFAAYQAKVRQQLLVMARAPNWHVVGQTAATTPADVADSIEQHLTAYLATR